MSRVSTDDLEQSIAWLEECDAGNEMRHSCLRVAEWLKTEAARREKDAAIRAVAREQGVRVSAVRKVLQQAVS